MDIITRCCVLFLWLHTLPFVKSDVCTRDAFLDDEDLNDGNFNTVGLKPTYPAGDEVRVGCRAGYSGFFKMQCLSGGRWYPVGSKCKAKSCGHPGDAPNADFALDRGNDYVFGSRVIYTCHEGYHMVSRRNSRNCVERGWDGVIPVCEALTCPVLPVDNNVLVLGDPEEASYGSVLRFRCKDRKQVVTGKEEIFCQGDGKWSDEAPKCTKVTCTVPKIEHGSVPGNRQEYDEDDILDYECDPHYGRIDFRSSTCTKLGKRADWSPTPVCERILCERDLQDPFVVNFNPPQLIHIRVSDTATYSCIRGYKKKVSKATCTGQGWTPDPLCEEITCDPNRLPNADVEHLKPVYKDQERVNVVCKPGYKGGYTATCTVNGWRGRGECTDVTCNREDYNNAEIDGVKRWQYKYNERVDYICKNGFTGRFTLTCGQDGWIKDRDCAAVTCTTRTFPHADIAGTPKPVYNYNDKVQYDCKDDPGLFVLTCGQNGWVGSDQCKEVTCTRQDLPDTEIVGDIKSFYAYKETVEYSCTGKQPGSFVLTCGDGKWIGDKQCKACPKPKVEHGFIVGPQNNMLYYTCEQGYKLMAKDWWGVTKCNSQEALAECIEESDCGALPAIPNMEVSSQQTNHTNGSSVEIHCKEGYSSEVQHLKCNEGQWHPNNMSLCTPIVKHCGSPPQVENAVPTKEYQKEYPSGSEITYECRYHHTMNGGPTITCNNGEWGENSSRIRCTRITTHCPRAPKVEHAEIISENRIFQSGQSANYQCQGHYTLEGDPTIMCNNGEWGEKMFECTLVPCERPDVPDNVRVHGLPEEGGLINPGGSLTFSCERPRTLRGHGNLTCGSYGQWDHPVPSCEVTCERPVVPENVIVHGLPEEGGLISPGDSLTFSCDHPRTRKGYAKLTCGADGQWNHKVPSCEAPRGSGCGRPPLLRDGDMTTSAKDNYRHNERVEYSCFNLYTMEGGPFKTCKNGDWTEEITCIKPCTVDEDLMAAHNIEFKYSYKKKLYATHGEGLEFRCTRGRHDGSVEMRQICDNGVINLPNCVRSS